MYIFHFDSLEDIFKGFFLKIQMKDEIQDPEKHLLCLSSPWMYS